VDINFILGNIREQAVALAKKLFLQYTQQAIHDVKDYLETAKADLKRWTDELARHQIDKDEFRSLVRGQIDVREMRALKQAGLAQVQIDRFTDGLLDIVVSAAIAAIP
jgi:hypothetical protein